MPLNDKQQRFVEEYLIDLNATQAALRAGYSEKTAYSQGQRLLKDAEVADAVAKASADRSEKTKIDAAWVLSRLATEATADVADLYDEAGNVKPVKDWPLIWRQGLVAGLDVEEFKSDGKTVSVIKKIKVSDRTKRLELIGKHISVGAFAEKVEHSGSVTVENLADRIQRAKKRK